MTIFEKKRGLKIALFITNLNNNIMKISIENNVSKVIDFKLNGILVAVIGLSGGLVFLKSANNLTIKQIEFVENECIKYNNLNK